MNINRHNYEEFFLLYVDNELSAAEKNAVYVFVEQNPDLEEELLMLKQSIVKHDEFVFEDKHSLLKEEITALQEKLLLFADAELPFVEQKEVAALLANDVIAATEWNILQQTKLQPDISVVFADKRSLYRTEAVRIVGFKWWRVAAAAILLGFGIWTGVAVYQHNSGTKRGAGEITGSNKNKAQQHMPNEPEHPAVNPPPKDNPLPETITASSLQKNSIPQPVEKMERPFEKLPRQKNDQLKDNVVSAGVQDNNKRKSNNLSRPINDPALENINKDERNKNTAATVQPKTPVENNNTTIKDVAINKTEKKSEPVKTPTDINTGTSANAFAKTALYNETDEGKNDNKILYMDEDKVKRTKIGGIFRKLKRVIERNTNIKTGDGIKVAGFEIAIK